MTEDPRNAIGEHQRLVQRILSGRIPAGRGFDPCHSMLQTDCDDVEAFTALFTLLQGALADLSFGMEDTQKVVPILEALTRGEVGVRTLK